MGPAATLRQADLLAAVRGHKAHDDQDADARQDETDDHGVTLLSFPRKRPPVGRAVEMPPRLTAQSRVEELLRVPAWKWPPTCAHTQFRGRPDVAGPSAGRVHPARRAQWTTASWHAETNRQHTRTGCPSGHAVVANHLGGECLRPTTGVFGEHRPATRVRDDTRLKYRRRYLPGVTRRHTKTATCRRLPIRADRTRNSYLARLRGSGPEFMVKPRQTAVTRGRRCSRCRSRLAAADVLVAGAGIALAHLPRRETGEGDGGRIEETEAEQPPVTVRVGGSAAEEHGRCGGSANGADSLGWVHSVVLVGWVTYAVAATRLAIGSPERMSSGLIALTFATHDPRRLRPFSVGGEAGRPRPGSRGA